MGIRYYAYPIDANLIDFARQSPRAFLGADPLMDAWGPAEKKPPMLYLDKCWAELQELLGANSPSSPRPAFALVAGRVTHTSEGWIPHIAVCDPAEVAAIASDLALITEAEVRLVLTDSGILRRHKDVEEELDYVNHYLREAQLFTSDLASAGKGLVYMIG
jgi:hypothetical protein